MRDKARRSVAHEKSSAPLPLERDVAVFETGGKIVGGRRAVARRVIFTLRKCSPDVTIGVLERCGFDLLALGQIEAVEALLASLPADRSTNAAALTLRGFILNQKMQGERAETLWKRALEAEPSAGMQSRIYRCLARYYFSKDSAAAFDSAKASMRNAPLADVAEGRALCAVILASMSKFEEALVEARRAIATAIEADSEPTLARVYSNASQVSLLARQIYEAEQLALRAVALAQALDDSAALHDCYETLRIIAIDYKGDLTEAQMYTRASLMMATKNHNKLAQTRLRVALFSIAVSLGDRRQATTLLRKIRLKGTFGRGAPDLARCMAIYHGWDGRFDMSLRALDMIDESSISYPEHRICFAAARAFFAACAGKGHLAIAALRRVDASYERLRSGHDADSFGALAQCLAAFAEIKLGKHKAALGRHIPASAVPQIVALRRVLPLLAGRADERGYAIELLHNANEHGYAMLLEIALSSHLDRDTLTNAELHVLVQLSNGKSPKNIAAASDRSVETIRRQIKSLNKKLGASSMLEAIAIARKISLV